MKKPKKKVLSEEEKRKIYSSIRKAAQPTFSFYKDWERRSAVKKKTYMLR